MTYDLDVALKLNALMDEAHMRALIAAFQFAIIAEVTNLDLDEELRNLLNEFHDARLDYEGRVHDAYAYSQRPKYAPEPGEPGGPQEPDDNPGDNEERKEREQ